MTDEGLRFDFIVTGMRAGADRAAVEEKLVSNLGANPEKVAKLLDHLAARGPVCVEPGVSQERLAELKMKWEDAGMNTSSKQTLAIMTEAPVAPSNTVKCPACGHEQQKKDDINQCEKCGVFPHKYAEQQRKNELIRQERERLEKMHSFTRAREEQEDAEEALEREKEEIRRQLEEEMGLNKKPKGAFGWLTISGPKGTAIRVGASVIIVCTMVGGGWFVRDMMQPKEPQSPEEIAKAKADAKKQGGEAMQKAVGQLVVGSKKMAEQSGAGAELGKQLFGDKDPDMMEQMQSLQTGSADLKDSIGEQDRAAGLSQMAKDVSESPSGTQGADRALSASMQSAKEIKDDRGRAEKVSSVAAAHVEVHTMDARRKSAAGDWRSADRAFAKAMAAATDITTKREVAVARSAVAKARAETGDYGGAVLIFLDAFKLAEEIGDPRDRALALAEVAKNIAETTNDLGGAAERGFEKALAAVGEVKKEPEKTATRNAVLLMRFEAVGNIASVLMTAEKGPEELRALLDRLTKDIDLLSDIAQQSRALGIVARITAELQGPTDGVEILIGRIVKMAEGAPDASRELIGVLVARGRTEVQAAVAKFNAKKGDAAGARAGFLQAMKLANGVSTKSQDPGIRSEVARHRVETLGVISRYMQATGDKQAAARLINLALDTGGAK
jgi:hypothetical protein